MQDCHSVGKRLPNNREGPVMRLCMPNDSAHSTDTGKEADSIWHM